MVRVLQIVTQMNRAGLESRLMDIYRHLDREKVQFDFLTCREELGFYDKEITELGGRVFYEKPLNLKVAFSIPRRFMQFFQAHPEYVVAHCHLNQWCGLVLLGAKHAGVRVRIAHARTSLESKSIKNLVKNTVKLPVNLSATHRFAVSGKAGSWLFGKQAQESGQVQVWPNAIQAHRFGFDGELRAITRLALGLTNELTLIHVGNLRPEKNHGFLLQVFQALQQQQPKAVLLVVGQDYLDGKVMQQAEDLGIKDKVRFLGARNDIPALLCAGDVLVFPSLYEGFPGAVLEAQASGLPCVISDTITPEIIMSDYVMQMSLYANAEAWSLEIMRQASRGRNLNALSEIVEKGYDIDSLAAKYTKLYSELANQIEGE